MNKLRVLELVNRMPNWEEILMKEPYNLIIKHKEPFVLLKYNQIESDMSNPIVQECRGLILKKIENTFKIASMRFTKFFNYGQEEAAKLDFDSPVEISEKIDGSLISMFYDEDSGWHISTSGNIDASDSPIQFQTNEIKTYRDLFLNAISFSYDELDKNLTYIFELVSPYNRVIVPYKETNIYLLSIRDNNTLEELDSKIVDNIGRQLMCKLPKKHECFNIGEALSAVNKLKEDSEHFEGFVLRDCHNNRIKLKSEKYMELFFIKGEGVFSPKKILQIILDEADDDILGHFPEYKDDFDTIRRDLSLFISRLKHDLREVNVFAHKDKKTFAEHAKNSFVSDALFKAYTCLYWNKNEEEQGKWLESYIKNMSISKLLDKLGSKKGE